MFGPNNFIYFFTVCGFFIGLMFSVMNFNSAEDVLGYTIGITLAFYLFIHIIIMNFVDIKKFGASLFNKKEYEKVSEYFIKELDDREKVMDSLLLEVEKMNIKYKQESKNEKEQDRDAYKKAA